MSLKDRLERKKYIGVWRWESELTIRMMSRFPKMVTRYMDRNRLKMRSCRFGSSENLRRMNSEATDRFIAFLLMNLMVKIGSRHNKIYEQQQPAPLQEMIENLSCRQFLL
jgi:hypothetical protein